MASKVILIGLVCLVLAAVAQSAPQYEKNEEATYDEDDSSVEEVKTPAPSDSDDDYDSIIAGLSESFGTAQDAGRRLGDGKENPASSASVPDE